MGWSYIEGLRSIATNGYYSSMAILLENYQLPIEIEKGKYPQPKEVIT